MNERRSLTVYLLMVGWCIVTLVYGRVLLSGHPGIRLFDGEALAVVCLGFFAVPYQHLAGLPSLLDHRVGWRQRLLAPLATGLAFALVDLLIFRFVLVRPHTDFLQPFPYSLFYFGADAFYVEVIYRLLPFTILLSLTGHPQLREGRTPLAFWAVAACCALAAPYQLLVKGPRPLMLGLYALHFVFNILQAVFYKQAGLLAAVFMRLGHYLLWYVLLGVCLQ